MVTTPPSFEKIHQRKRETIYCHFCFLCSHHKNRKTLMFSFERAQIALALVISARAMVTIGSHLKLIIGRCTHITDISKPTFNDYQGDGGLAKHEIQLKSAMGNLVRDA